MQPSRLDRAGRLTPCRGLKLAKNRRDFEDIMANATEKQALQKPSLQVLLCSPRGFCAGVVRAIDIVERALTLYGPPVYVRHEIVHNRHVVERLERMGARFVEELAEVPAGAHTIFSAHGVSKAVEADAAERGLAVLDATCPLVAKVHIEGKRYVRQGRQLIL